MQDFFMHGSGMQRYMPGFCEHTSRNSHRCICSNRERLGFCVAIQIIFETVYTVVYTTNSDLT